MDLNSIKKTTLCWLISIVVLLVVSGCGGGGGDGSNSIPNEAAWSFDNLSGSTAPNTKSSELSASLNSVTVVRGVVGNGIRFDPSLTLSSAIISLHRLRLTFPDGRISIAMWINPSRLENGATYHLFGTYFSFNLHLIDGRVAFLLSPAAGALNNQDLIAQSRSTVKAGVWQHVAITYDGITAKLYLDGALDTTVSLAHHVGSLGDTSIYIGGLPPESGFKLTFPGTVDEVYFSGQTLSAAEVASMAAKPVGL